MPGGSPLAASFKLIWREVSVRHLVVSGKTIENRAREYSITVATGWNRRALFSRDGFAAGRAELLAALNPEPAPADRKAELTVARRAMACEFSVVFPAGFRRAVDAGCAALDEVERLERKLSVYLDDSDVSCLNRQLAASAVAVDRELYGLLRWAARLSAATGGAFDATSGALVKAWGFYRGPKRVPSDSERAAALAACGWSRLVFDDGERTIRAGCPGLEFNLGSIGKGFAIDCALRLVQTRFRIGCALMHGGQSSLKGIGTPPGEPRGWTVAIGDPWRPQRTLARVRLLNRALGTSGAANQFFVERGRRYGHVLDPRTGWPAHSLFSASAIAGAATEADALSTAFFVTGVEGTRRFCADHPDVGAVLVAPGKTRNARPEVLVIGAADVEVMV